MAKAPSKDVAVYVDEFDLSGGLNAAEQQVDNQQILVVAFQDAGPRRVEGNYDFRDVFGGFFDGADNDIDEQIFALLGDNADHYVCKGFDGDAENDIAYEGVVHLSRQPRRARNGEAVLLDFDADGRNGLYRGLFLRNASIVGTGAGTGRNMGASTSGQTFAAVIRAISGTFASVTVDIQESQDDGSVDTYANISGMSATLTAAGVSRVTTTAATEAWKRVNVSAFSGTSVLLVVTAGIVAGT